MSTDLSAVHASERAHHDTFYADAIRTGFFDREGFRQLVAWNLAAMRRAIPFTSRMRVLSIGCGLGDYEIALAPHVGTLVGVDLSPVAVDEAVARARRAAHDNVTFRCSAGIELSFADGAFDLVYALGVFHHLAPIERRETLRRAHGWIAPGGWVYLRDPNARGLVRRCCEPFFRDRSDVHTENEAALDPHILAEEVRQAGFHEPRVDYIDVIGGPLPWLVGVRSRLFWKGVFAIDRAWLATPLRPLASQFAIGARRW